jgi:hypothetical protein
VQLLLRGLEPGEYSIRVWNTREGRGVGNALCCVSQDRTLRYALPLLENDVALCVQSVMTKRLKRQVLEAASA